MKNKIDIFFASFLRRENAGKIGVILFTATTLIAIMTPIVWDTYWSVLDPSSFSTGKVANYSVQAPREYLLEDKVGTERRRAKAASRVKQVYKIADTQKTLSKERLRRLFVDLSEFATPESREKGSLFLTLSPEKKKEFSEQYRLDFSDDEWSILLNKSRWFKFEDVLQELVDPYLGKGIVANKQLIDNSLARTGVSIIRESDSRERDLYSSRELLDYAEAKDLFLSALQRSSYYRRDSHGRVLRKLGLMLLEPNVSLDLKETDKRINFSMSQIEPDYYRIKRGEFIVRAGDIVSPSQQELLAQIRKQHNQADIFRSFFGYLVLSVLILTTVYLFTINIWSTFKPSSKDLLIISLVLIGSLCSIKVCRFLGDSLSFSYPDLQPSTLLLLAPLAAGGILLEVTMGAASVFIFTMTFALLTGVFIEDSGLLILLIIMGNIAGGVSVRECPRRSIFISAGIRVALINLLIMLSFVLLEPQASGAENTLRVSYVIVSGLLSGLIAASTSPIIEYLGSYITDMKLMELASLDRPLLREVSVQAPGTWNHSMVMGQMGEAASEAIGANSLLTRVGAYYHDIGKIKNPTYFIENQTDKDNKHEKLAPSMSALIIKAHVKHGLELAKQHKVPRPLRDFIREHHGTSLIEYFYDKAIKEAEEDEVVDEANYRYSGPKPQTKESGILMLADAVEASSRTLSDPTPAKIQGLVQKIINKIFASGELGESELTLKDLHLIAKEFTRVLQGIHHRRVEYSESAEKTKNDDTKTDTKSKLSIVKPEAKGKEDDRHSGETENKDGSGEGDEDKKSSESGKDTLKRLGI